MKGSDNQVADSLSRDSYYLPPKAHKYFLRSVIPHQLPQNFHIRPMPKEISPLITWMLLQLPETQLQSSTPKVSDLECGNIGTLTYISSRSLATYWTECPLSTKNIIMSGFAQAVRQGTFSRGNHTNLVEGTALTTLAHVAQAFRTNNRKEPRLDTDGKTCYIIQEQLRGVREK